MNTVLILKSDRLLAQALRQAVLRVQPESQVQLAMSAGEAAGILAARPVELLVTGLESDLKSDVLELLAGSSPRTQTRVLVLIGHDAGRVLCALHTLPIHGVFDSLHEEPAAFDGALRVVIGGGRYWSKSIWHRIHLYRSALDSPEKTLTIAEQMMLAVLGDGRDDNAAADTLGLSTATVSTVRRNLHRKLCVHHRGELVGIAVRHGFVRFTADGVIRPGFSLLCAAYHSQKKKPTTAAAVQIHTGRDRRPAQGQSSSQECSQ